MEHLPERRLEPPEYPELERRRHDVDLHIYLDADLTAHCDSPSGHAEDLQDLVSAIEKRIAHGPNWTTWTVEVTNVELVD